MEKVMKLMTEEERNTLDGMLKRREYELRGLSVDLDNVRRHKDAQNVERRANTLSLARAAV